MAELKDNVMPMKATNEIEAMKTPETVKTSNEAKAELRNLILEEAMRSPVVQSFIRGLSAGLGLRGNFILQYDSLDFVKRE